MDLSISNSLISFSERFSSLISFGPFLIYCFLCHLDRLGLSLDLESFFWLVVQFQTGFECERNWELESSTSVTLTLTVSVPLLFAFLFSSAPPPLSVFVFDFIIVFLALVLVLLFKA